MESAPPPDGDANTSYIVAIPTIITVAIAGILTVARLYVRIRLLAGLEWDDFFNVLATVSNHSGARPRVDTGHALINL